MPFRFRAQAALELRRREEEDARRSLGIARREVAAAASTLAAAEAGLAECLKRARDEQAHATDTLMRAWLRNWLVGQRREVASLQHALARRRDEERAAAGQLLDATRRVRTLAQLRERLLEEHETEERRAEQRELNWLGCLRYVATHSEDNRMPRPGHRDCGEEVKVCQ
ncbi:MAG TPA: flagellar FliJ family protein [Vicinamibacterales bacterium]|nr:flagellar FliJ family protein [Vicinamibacterales bacterium]